MEFKGFTLDPFQEQAIRTVEDGNSVIVAAPTGAGKTVIAEYAIEKALADGKQVVYTAPIKALSNQKFRDFSKDYPGRIGIMTGDVIINPEAQVLIMTTEIFRNIIFDAGSERLNNIETVIFDEIHYINDIQRGTVWEESIIFAPQHIRFICLSATIPNFEEFAEWMRAVRDIPIVAVSEKHRPVPLNVKIWIPGAGFRDLKYIKGMESDPGRFKKSRKGSNIDLVHHLKRENQFPCLYFHFSRMGCEEYANHFRGANLLNKEEMIKVLGIYDGLCEQFEIKGRGQATLMRNLLKSGVAFHHAGVLPALKEILERIYTLGLIKLLFTTETFAVGINMPARAVIFNSIMKNDGISFRYLTAREFQQMSGRAGRRGIDDEGFAYACVQPRDANYEGVRQTLSKDAEDIQSQFSLSYSSILNLYDTYRDKIYEVCEKSFNNYKTVEQVRRLNERAEIAESEIERMKDSNCLHGAFIGRIDRYLDLSDKFFKMKNKLRKKNQVKGPGTFELNEKLRELKLEMDAIECTDCKRLKACRGRFKKIRLIENGIKDIGEEVLEVENSQKTLLGKRMKFLTKLGYINEEGLLPRGKIASQIFGYEMVFTELYFEGFFEELDEAGTNVLVCSIVFESRRGATYKRFKEKDIVNALSLANDTVEWLRSREREIGAPAMIKSLDPKLNYAVYEWSRGCKFEDLKTFTSSDDGDLVRSFRLIVDFLRQLKRAINEPAFRAKMDRCVELLYRDVVDAEAQLKKDLEPASGEEEVEELPI